MSDRSFILVKWLLPVVGLVSTAVLAAVDVPLANSGFNFASLPSSSTNTTGYTVDTGTNVVFYPLPSGGTTDNQAQTSGWSKSGSGSAGFQRLASSQWAGTPPSGGVGYANNGGALRQTVFGVLVTNREYVLSGTIYLRASDPLPSDANVVVKLLSGNGTELAGSLVLGTLQNGQRSVVLTANSGAVADSTDLVIHLGNTNSGYAQVNFDNLTLSYTDTAPPTPSTSPPMMATAPTVVGWRPGTPFVFHLAAAYVGSNRVWQCSGLPAGLTLDSATGNITGTMPAAGTNDVAWSVTGSEGQVSATVRLISGDALALTPPVGWNSWNGFEGNVSEMNVQEIADAIVRSGLLDLGFAYVNLDDKWAVSTRTNVVVDGVTESRLQPNATRFPNGLKALADYLNARGLRFGIYSDAASKTCSGSQPGSYGYEAIDARTFAEWGVDFVKYDYCGAPGDQATAIQRYTTMGNALAASGRSMIFSLCEWGQRQPWTWGTAAGGHMWRTTYDMRDNWQYQTSPYRSQSAVGVLDAYDLQRGLESYQSPGGWNDPDMLMVGVDLAGSAGDLGATGLNRTQEKTMFSLWALMSAPMIFNADLRKLDPLSAHYNAGWAANFLDIVGNTEVWDIHRDPAGNQAVRLRTTGSVDVCKKTLSNGDVVLGVINRTANSLTGTVYATDSGLAGSTVARDLWQHADLGPLASTNLVPLLPYETVLLRIQPAPPLSPFAAWQMAHFGCTNCDEAAASANPAGDGLANLIKYTLGLDPNVAVSNPLQFNEVVTNGYTYLRLSVTRDPNVTNVTIAGLSASNLVDWATDTTVIESNTSGFFLVRDALPIETNNQRFLKLRFIMP